MSISATPFLVDPGTNTDPIAPAVDNTGTTNLDNLEV
jgi:hypothetical protein